MLQGCQLLSFFVSPRFWLSLAACKALDAFALSCSDWDGWTWPRSVSWGWETGASIGRCLQAWAEQRRLCTPPGINPGNSPVELFPCRKNTRKITEKFLKYVSSQCDSNYTGTKTYMIKKNMISGYLIKTGATLFDLSFLWTHKKLISTIFTVFLYIETEAGTADMKPTSFRLFVALKNKCRCFKRCNCLNALKFLWATKYFGI